MNRTRYALRWNDGYRMRYLIAFGAAEAWSADMYLPFRTPVAVEFLAELVEIPPVGAQLEIMEFEAKAKGVMA